MSISFSKLKTGDWGLRAENEKEYISGDSVVVKKKDGTTSRVKVVTQVWTDGYVALYTFKDNTTGGDKFKKPGSATKKTSGKCKTCNGDGDDCYECRARGLGRYAENFRENDDED